MFKSIKSFFITIIDFFLPPRTDFAIVKQLDAEKINNLPEAENVTQMDWIHPLFQYKDNKVRAIIWELKYRENILPLEHIGKLFYEEIIALISDIVLFDNDAQFLLIPIPITNERRVERGYNQSELIAKSILKNDLARTLLYAPQWFSKTKETPKQSRSESKQERQQNLIGCFEADQRVSGKYIILVDDVVTTGSTLSEARKTLLEVGARDVFAFTIAH
ncbi:MAG: phosphoribosyltransferase family protein [Candidatus Paceibacterota bacterium]|jgi:ComF family protein